MIHVARSLLFVFGCLIALSGCGSTRDITFRTYVQDKPRVDQVVEGSLGNWNHAPELVDADRKPTRRVYIMEFAREDDRTLQMTEIIEGEATSLDRPSMKSAKLSPPVQKRKVKRIVRQQTPEIKLPSFDDIDDTMETPKAAAVQLTGSFVDYKVEKNDTLQKIAKKFYDSYSKWTLIYEANRDVIKNPNRIRSGIVIKIPQ